MKARKCLILFFCLCLAATMLFVDRVGIQPARAQFGTTITVTTTRDPDNSNSTTCAHTPLHTAQSNRAGAFAAGGFATGVD